MWYNTHGVPSNVSFYATTNVSYCYSSKFEDVQTKIYLTLHQTGRIHDQLKQKCVSKSKWQGVKS